MKGTVSGVNRGKIMFEFGKALKNNASVTSSVTEVKKSAFASCSNAHILWCLIEIRHLA